VFRRRSRVIGEVGIQPQIVFVAHDARLDSVHTDSSRRRVSQRSSRGNDPLVLYMEDYPPSRSYGWNIARNSLPTPFTPLHRQLNTNVVDVPDSAGLVPQHVRLLFVSDARVPRRSAARMCLPSLVQELLSI